jgi:hypothetical protein
MSTVASRSADLTTRAVRPTAARAVSASGACRSLISLSRCPPGASHPAAPAVTRRSTSSPSGPPSRAALGSCARASGGRKPISADGT